MLLIFFLPSIRPKEEGTALAEITGRDHHREFADEYSTNTQRIIEEIFFIEYLPAKNFWISFELILIFFCESRSTSPKNYWENEFRRKN